MNNGTNGHVEPTPKIVYRSGKPRWQKTVPDSVRPVKVNSIEMLTDVWPYVRDRLEVIKKKDKSTQHWLPEHVRHAVMQGLFGQNMTELYVALDTDNSIYGFIVTEVLFDRFVNIPLTLWIWVGWLNREMIDRMTPWLEKIAKERGLTRIEWDSGRFGWLGTVSQLKTAGFRLVKQGFRKEIR